MAKLSDKRLITIREEKVFAEQLRLMRDRFKKKLKEIEQDVSDAEMIVAWHEDETLPDEQVEKMTLERKNYILKKKMEDSDLPPEVREMFGSILKGQQP